MLILSSYLTINSPSGILLNYLPDGAVIVYIEDVYYPSGTVLCVICTDDIGNSTITIYRAVMLEVCMKCSHHSGKSNLGPWVNRELC